MLHQILAFFVRKNKFTKMSCQENGKRRFSFQWCSIASVITKKNASEVGEIIIKFECFYEQKWKIQANPVQVPGHGEHTKFTTLLVRTSQSNEFLSWMNKWPSTDKIWNHHNFATTQTIFKQKTLSLSPKCVDSQNRKITCSKNAWDLHFAKISCSKFCMFYSIQLT